MPRHPDIGWQHGTMIGGKRHHVQCNYCHRIMIGGITRFKKHLASKKGEIKGCDAVPRDVRDMIRKQLTILKPKKGAEKKRKRAIVGCSIAPSSGDHAIDPNASGTFMNVRHDLPGIGDMITHASEPGIQQLTGTAEGFDAFSIPAFNEQEVRKSWDEAGCTIMVDRWINKVGHAMISFYAYSLKGTVFLSSVDASGYENSSEGLSNLFDSIIQEVGPRNVVTFLTDATPRHRAAARILMNKYQTFFSCICANHCIELILNAIAEMDEVKDIMAKMKKICQVAYNNVWILNSLREKTEGKEVFQHSATEFVAKFSTLLNMVALKEPLQQVFISTSWEQPVLSEQKLGSEVIDILLDLQFWSSCSRIMKVIKPLLAVLHQVDGEERPSMGYFYDSVEKARKGIISAFDSKESDYHPYLDIIDNVREELHSPLHSAAYYLNPSVYYNSGFVFTNVIQKSLLDCIETLETNLLSQDNITRQKSFYEDAVGDFSRPVAIRGRETLSPATWWSLYASDYPELQCFAIRILSQTCTIMTSQKNLFKNEYIQIKHTNKLEIERMKDLNFVRYNLHFLQRQSATSSGSKTSMRDEYDPMCCDGLHSAAGDWIENPGSLELENNSWRNLVLPGDVDLTTNNGCDVDDSNLSAEVESNNSSQDSDDTDDSG
ncbi:hypothetical protein M5K25_018001 [Dendrobium thyrsiflorum]|uniref:BED-type domain-containing protein n=1 Tax=Dendrobium thyrsiflorum TaxID=117978 RepID=A0ABD0UPD6_DENTH